MKKRVCPKCGEKSPISAYSCLHCNSSLTSAEIVEVDDSVDVLKVKSISGTNLNVCHKCGCRIKPNSITCTTCGANISRKVTNPTTEPLSNSNSNGNNTFLYVLSFLIPLVGFVAGGIMLTNDDSDKKDAGKKCVILGTVSTVICSIIIVIFYTSVFSKVKQNTDLKSLDNLTYYSAGKYQAGDTIDAGEYFVLAENGDFYVEVSENGNSDSIVTNDIGQRFTFVSVEEGQHLYVEQAKFALSSKLPDLTHYFDFSNGYTVGTYRVGKDIPAGKYLIKPDGNRFYYVIYSDSHKKHEIALNSGFVEEYINVSNGECLKIGQGIAIQ